MSKQILCILIGLILIGLGIFLTTNSYDLATHGVDVSLSGNWSESKWGIVQNAIGHIGEIIVATGCGAVLITIYNWIRRGPDGSA